MSEKRFKPYSVSTTDGDGFVIGIQKEDGTVMSITNASEMLNEQQDTIERLKRRLDYETRMHKRWKDDCLAILEEQDLNDYVEELQKSKKNRE